MAGFTRGARATRELPVSRSRLVQQLVGASPLMLSCAAHLGRAHCGTTDQLPCKIWRAYGITAILDGHEAGDSKLGHVRVHCFARLIVEPGALLPLQVICFGLPCVITRFP